MRVDKYLQVSGLVKRRVMAQRLCDAGRVAVNDRRVKPGTTVTLGDILDLSTGGRRMRVRILTLPASPRDAARTPPYEAIGAEGPLRG